MQTLSVTMTMQFNMYLEYLLQEKESSYNTVMAYKRDLGKVFEFASMRYIDSFADMTVEDVEEYKLFLSSCGLSSATISRSLSALRSIFQYLVLEGIMESNPARSVHNDKAEKKELSILTSDEIEALLKQPKTKDPKGCRDKAMLELMYATGIKVSELLALNVNDINFTLSCVRCGSGENERLIPLYPVALKFVSDYLDKARSLLITSKNEQALFVNFNGERMSRQGFCKILKQYVADARIDKEVSPQSLRNSFAAHLLENGADVHDIQEILGHRDPASTQVYIHYLKEKMKTGYIKFHPHA